MGMDEQKQRFNHVNLADLNGHLTNLPSAFGVFVVTLLKMLTKTRNRVISRAIRPSREKLILT